MTLPRSELEAYVRYAERLSEDLEVTIHDLRFRAAGGRLHIVIDFSEVHSFLMPDQLDDSWLWPGLDERLKAVVEHSALSEVMTGPPRPILLHPYLLEFQNFVSNLRLGIIEQTMRELPAALQTLEELTSQPQTRQMLELASRVKGEGRALTAEELATAVSFFEANARDLVGIVSGEVLQPLARTKAFLSTNPFSALDEVVPVRLTGREPEVAARYQRLRRLRNFEKDGASFIDALGLEYVRRANLALASSQQFARVLMVSRSQKLHDLVRDEARQGLWPVVPHGVLRHPRAFAPLAWQVERAAVDPVPGLTATRASLDLCRRSAGIRLKGMWTSLGKGGSDGSLNGMVCDIKSHIISLVEMGGGVNESRVVAAKRQPNQNEVLQLLAMLLDRQEVFRAIASRMAEINRQLDGGHEAIGVMLHTHDEAAKEIAVFRSAKDERVVLPRMGRLPYGLKFHTRTFLTWLDELQRKGEIRPDDLFVLFARAASERADHYETLLFMGYTLAVVGEYGLASDYCMRALQSARHHGRRDVTEGRFFQAVCDRVLAREPARLAGALETLTQLLASAPTEPRLKAEQGNVMLSWWLRARDSKVREWRTGAPAVDDCLRTLGEAEALCGDDVRLRASVQNSLCYAYSLAYLAQPAPAMRAAANAALDRLIGSLRTLDPDLAGWPMRIKDTIAETILATNPDSFDRAFLEEVVTSFEKDLEHGGVRLGDRKPLLRRLRHFRQALADPSRWAPPARAGAKPRSQAH